MPEAGANSGGISRKTLIPVGVAVFFLSAVLSYSIFHRQEAAVPGNIPPAQADRVPEEAVIPAENAPPEAAPSEIASEPSPSQGLPQESSPAAKPVAPVQAAKPKGSPEKSPPAAVGKEKEARAVSEKKETAKTAPPAEADKEKEPKAEPKKAETAAVAPGKAEEPKTEPVKAEAEAKTAPVKDEAQAEAAPAPVQKEEVAKAPAEKKPGKFKLRIGEYPDLKSMLKDMNKVKDLGFETAFEEKETKGGKKDYFLVVEKEFNAGEAKAESLKLKVVHKLATSINPGPEGKSQVWIGPFAKLTEATKTTKMLKEEGYSTRVEEKINSGKKIYLFAGPFAEKPDMIKAKALLEKNGFSPVASSLP